MDKKFAAFFVAAVLVYASVAIFYPLVGDEQIHGYFARWTAEHMQLPISQKVNGLLWYHYPPAYAVVAGFFVKLFSGLIGAILSARIYAFIASLATFVLVYKFVTKRLPQADTTILLAYLVASPFLSSNAGIATITPLGLLTSFATIYLLYEFFDKPTTRSALLLAGALAAALLTHYYLLTLPLAILAAAYFNRERVNWRFLIGALALGCAVGGSFYAYNLITYGQFGGPSSSTIGQLVSPFDPGCVYIDGWLSGLNGFVHFDDSFARIDGRLKFLPISTKWLWSAGIAFLYLLIAAGAVASAKKDRGLIAIAFISLPTLVLGNCFIRYSGVLPLLFGVFLTIGVNAVGPKLEKPVKVVVLLLLAVLLVQTFLTMQGVRESKVPIYDFIKAVPDRVDAKDLCFFSHPGEPISVLATLLTNQEIQPCHDGGYTTNVLVLKDLRTFERDYTPEDLAKLNNDYVLVDSQKGGDNEIALYKLKTG
jgi:hypothetical protein